MKIKIKIKIIKKLKLNKEVIQNYRTQRSILSNKNKNPNRKV
jgi:hypothetical protein